ncbi:MAG TPA: YciK family oxidoreductase [Steroidobacteraceae bacterium]|jgi:NAD(P)-dependent dehydrogenase (short-subunit alcohol dehydrogenase family)|nr:YciK family oxidoreductase [Steroidobacteraceae bacterium]
MTDPRTYKPAADALSGRVVLVTGASDGIGKAVAQAAAAHGATVLLHGRNVRKLEAVYDAIVAAKQPRPSIVPLDFEKAGPEEYEKLATALEQEFGRLDALLHNAGMLGERAPIEHHDIPKWMRTMHVNVTAPFILTRYCLPLLKRSADPSIVFTSSGVVARPRAYWGAYLASKWASEGLMRMLADELEQPQIRVNSIDPGKVRTRMRLAAYPAEDPQTLPTPESIVAPYLFLLGPESRGVSGEAFSCQ